jgi:hypothetical protein
LVGAELNAEIEHASPYGKDIGEKVPGEKKRIGGLAERDYAERRAKGEIPVRAFQDGVNCDIERTPAPEERSVRASDLLIGTAALLPAAIKVGLDVRKQLSQETSRDKGEAA